MRRIPLIFLLLSFCLGVYSFAIAGETSPDPVTQLKWLESANPENDAKKAIKEKDFRLMAVYGYALEIPGVDPKYGIEYKKIYGINPIEGTSDFLISKEHMRLSKLAHEYAAKYNKAVLKYKKSETGRK